MQAKLQKTVGTVAVLGAVAAGSAAIAGAASDDSQGTQQSAAAQSPGSSGRSGETALTGDTAAKVRKAAQDKVPGGTVLRVETDADGGAAYEAHVRKSDGTEVTVLVDREFKVVAVRECGGPGGPGGRGGPPDSGQGNGQGTAPQDYDQGGSEPSLN